MDHEELMRKIASGEVQTLKVIPYNFNRAKIKPKVSTIYDRFTFKEYRNIPVCYLFKYDIGLIEWAIENYDGFCLQEYDYLSQFGTVNEKVFEMSYIRDETMKDYRYYSDLMSNEEIMAAFGSNRYELKSDVKAANDQKLEKYGLTKTPPKMMDRTYICFNRSSFPLISGKWIYEKTERSAKNTSDIVFFRCSDDNPQSGKEFLNQKIGIFDINELYTLTDQNNYKLDNAEEIKPGDVFEVTTNPKNETKYHFKKTS